MNPHTEQRYRDAIATVSKPRFYLTVTAALESLPPALRAAWIAISDAYANVPPAPIIRAVLVDIRKWADDCDVPVYEAGYWIQRIANIHVRITLGEGEQQVSGYRPIMMIEHVQLDDAGEPNIVAVSIPSYGDVTP